jgi:predicted phosphodiesterase
VPPPAPAEPLRIVSDLHLGHHGSQIGRVDDLAPLLEGVRTLVCNGDTWQELIAGDEAAARAMFDDWRALVAGRGVELLCLPGNHDPGCGERGWLELAGREVFVSHGDSLLREGAPWSRTLPARRPQVEALWQAAGPAAATLDGRLRLAGEIARVLLPPRLAPGRSFPARVWDALTPPGRAWRMIRAWIGFPTAAARFLDEFDLPARVFVCGHFHRTGIWRRRGRWIVNTGSFMPPGAAWCVDVTGRQLDVRRIDRRPDGTFKPGRLRRRITA